MEKLKKKGKKRVPKGSAFPQIYYIYYIVGRVNLVLDPLILTDDKIKHFNVPTVNIHSATANGRVEYLIVKNTRREAFQIHECMSLL